MINNSQDLQVVYIEGFDSNNKMVHVMPKNGGRIAVPFQLTGGVTRIPKVGETWIVRRFDSTNWFFEGRYSDTSYTKYTGGDVFVDSENYLYLNGTRVFINDYPVGVRECEEFDITAADVKELDITHTPIDKSLQAFNNGLLIAPSSILIEKKRLIFASALSIGKVVIYYDRDYI